MSKQVTGRSTFAAVLKRANEYGIALHTQLGAAECLTFEWRNRRGGSTQTATSSFDHAAKTLETIIERYLQTGNEKEGGAR